LGPDLTNVYSKKGAVYISAILRGGTNIMPNMDLTDSEIEELLAYLKDVDQSGKADPRTFTINTNGTIHQ
jgi:nitric oxide reductase subunit C